MNAPLPEAPLWGEWRCSQDPCFFTAWCAWCGGELWAHVRDDGAHVSCENGCAPEDIATGAAELLTAQRAVLNYEHDLKAIMEPDDPFYGIGATRYVAMLTGQEPSRGGFFRCPFHADGAERTPSLHATDLLPGRWFCHACQRGGTIYDFGALLWDIEPRRDGFGELRVRLGRELLRAS